jgi:hypothetical protein
LYLLLVRDDHFPQLCKCGLDRISLETKQMILLELVQFHRVITFLHAEESLFEVLYLDLVYFEDLIVLAIFKVWHRCCEISDVFHVVNGPLQQLDMVRMLSNNIHLLYFSYLIYYYNIF